MDKKTLAVTRDTVPPGRSLHFVFRALVEVKELTVSLVDREARYPSLDAEAVYDKEGWIVVLLTNTSCAPVTITPSEPLQIVIFPRHRQASLR